VGCDVHPAHSSGEQRGARDGRRSDVKGAESGGSACQIAWSEFGGNDGTPKAVKKPTS